MHLETVIAYAVVAWLSILTPGPAVVLSVRNALSHGPRSSIYSSLGNVCGLLVLAAASTFGLGAALRSSATAFAILKLVGALYLVGLGLRQLLAPPRTAIQRDTSPDWRAGRHSSFYMEGFALSVTNPKPILFFTALFPQFISATRPLLPQFALLTGIFMLLSFGTLVSYAFVAGKTRKLMQRPRLGMWLNRLCGTIFIAFGTSLLALKRPLTH